MASEHDELRDQAGSYVLGALDARERALFEAHLVSCESCAAEVRSLSTVAGALAYAVPQTDPRPALRARVMAEIETTFASHYAKQVSLAGALALDAIAAYGKQASGEKYLIDPSRSS